jgi:hypothetical protein
MDRLGLDILLSDLIKILYMKSYRAQVLRLLLLQARMEKQQLPNLFRQYLKRMGEKCFKINQGQISLMA